MNIFNTKIIFYKGAFILYRKFIERNRMKVYVKLIYSVNFTTYLIDEAKYSFTKDITLEHLITTYKKVIDDYNKQTKIN